VGFSCQVSVVSLVVGGTRSLSAYISLNQVTVTTASSRPPALRQKGLVAQPLLQDVTIELWPQQVVGVIGPTGAGKTSLLRLLNRLIDPVAGQILWQGEPYDKTPARQLRQQIMLVPQEPKLLGMTVQQALAYGLTLRDWPIDTISEQVERWRKRLQIPQDWLDLNEASLSLGQRQWVAIARTLTCEPGVLLLDEPAAHLDPERSAYLTTVLHKCLQQQSTDLIVIASHDWQWLSTVCHRVLYFHQGRLVQDSPAKNLDWDAIGEELSQDQMAIDREWE
jgi:D-methionine transport system ATP-binding protein